MTLLERLLEKVERVPESGCWLWTAAAKESGYGVIGLGSRAEGTEKAHRTSYRLHRGEIPSGANVLHKCGVACCVNPDHLYLGTLKDNARDTIAMGRARIPDNRGERAKWAKLRASDVQEIRQQKGRMRSFDLAKKYGVAHSTIRAIWCGQIWKSV